MVLDLQRWSFYFESEFFIDRECRPMTNQVPSLAADEQPKGQVALVGVRRETAAVMV